MEHDKGQTLVEGAFYWARPAFDVDAEGDDPLNHWTNQPQPARFAGYSPEGEDLWNWIGSEVEDWPAIWVGKRITP